MDRVYEESFNYIKVIKAVWALKYFIVFLTFVFTGSAYVYYWRIPVIYSSSASFFIPSSEQSLGLSGYSAILGSGSAQSNASTLMQPLVQSRRTQETILNMIQGPHATTIQAKINQLYRGPESASFKEKAEAVLDFSTNLMIEQKKESGVFILSFKSKDPLVSKLMVDYYLVAVESLNIELVLGSQRKVIQVLDRPLVPTESMRPKLVVYLLLGGLFSFIISSILCIFIKKIRDDFRSDSG